MAKITIDGKELNFEGKKMILQVALDNTHELPHYCYHPGLSVVASCRICLAEILAPNPKNNNALEPFPPGPPKLAPTCQTPAMDGMVVHTKTPKAIGNQKAVMEALLINHPLDCPVCDQAGECSLQDYSFKYGRAESRFLEDKIKQPKKDIGLNVYLYSDRCIMCTRCVRFTKEVTGTAELGVFGRGSREQIDVFPGRGLANELSGNVVDLCPVGALLDKDFLFTQRVWFLSQTPSIDGITSSGDNITVHHNEGQIYRLKPRANPEVNKWWISDEIRYSWKFVHSEDRLRSPKRLQLGTQVECDWSKAYEDARDSLKKAVNDGKHVALLVSPMLSSEDAYLLARAVKALDPGAVIGVGPVPVSGADKAFPGGYTIRAEKAPNARGVKRAIEIIVGENNALDAAAWQTAVKDAKAGVAAAIVTGNYPSAWATKELSGALSGKFLVLIDTLPNDLTTKANVLLPSATWLEKAGTFENHAGKLQAFEQAIPVVEFARSEGQIALDLASALGSGKPAIFDAAKTRELMGGVFVSSVAMPKFDKELESAAEYVTL